MMLFAVFLLQLKNVAVPPSEYRLEVLTDIALLTAHTTPFGIRSPVSYLPTVNPRPGRFARTYQMTSQSLGNVGFEQFLQLELNVGSSEWSKEEWLHYTTVPENEKYKALARSIMKVCLQFQDNQIAQAFAVKLFLDEIHNIQCQKDMEKTKIPRQDLFGPHKQYIGYCVHTSHAAAFLWRALGDSARTTGVECMR